MTNLFNFIAKYYDLLYEGKDTKSEVLYIDSILKKYLKNKNSILEFGLGTGRHAKEFIELGYKVHGIERSLDMCNDLSKINGLEYSIGDIANTNLNKKFDAVLSLFHVMSYQLTNEKILKVFGNANLHLEKGGLFIFDVWYSPAVNSIKPSIRIKRFSNKEFEITRLAEPLIFNTQNRVDVNYSFFIEDKINKKFDTFKEVHPMRHFSIPEIKLFASLSGFECLKIEEWLTEKKPSDNTWGVCFVLKKV